MKQSTPPKVLGTSGRELLAARYFGFQACLFSGAKVLLHN